MMVFLLYTFFMTLIILDTL